MGFKIGILSLMVMARWSEPVGGREESQGPIHGTRVALAREKSRTAGFVVELKGNLVKTPGVLRSVYRQSAANIKY